MTQNFEFRITQMYFWVTFHIRWERLSVKIMTHPRMILTVLTVLTVEQFNVRSNSGHGKSTLAQRRQCLTISLLVPLANSAITQIYIC